MHAEQAVSALESGVAVFCQKPLGRTAAEAQTVIAAARRHDLLLGVDLSYRFLNPVKKVRKLCREGELGNIYALDLQFHNAYGPDKPWFYDRRQSGGVYHSLVSDWNHGNAHFLRGVVSELQARGHQVIVYEPCEGWSRQNLVAEHGEEPLRKFATAYPQLSSVTYNLESLDLDDALLQADMALVHEWNEPTLIWRIGRHRAAGGQYRLYFHDTHHRMVTDPQSMARFDLVNYDGVLAYGAALRELYQQGGRVQRAWTWHEAADTRVFHPLSSPAAAGAGDVVWIGNWGDGERTAELETFLIEPIKELSLHARVYGVRYPDTAQQTLAAAGIEYGGWQPNFEVPAVFARYRVTLHVPRRPYVTALPGIPTIRPFEALACGIPLICSPWEDTEGLFTPGRDFLVARNRREMTQLLRAVLNEPDLAEELAAHGLSTIRARHTCAHRVEQLLAIDAEVRGAGTATMPIDSAPPFPTTAGGLSRPEMVQPPYTVLEGEHL